VADTYTPAFRSKGSAAAATTKAAQPDWAPATALTVSPRLRPVEHQPEPARASASFDAFLRAVERIEQAVDQETAALQQRKAADLRDFNHRKSHGLLELTRAMRGLDGRAGNGAVAARLGTLRTKLEKNRSILETHLQAVHEIAGIMSGAIREAESDGTYTAALRFGADMQ
jgi:hypothetical protein